MNWLGNGARTAMSARTFTSTKKLADKAVRAPIRRIGVTGVRTPIRGIRFLPALLLPAVCSDLTTMPGTALRQEARVTNAKTQNRAVTSGLEKEFQSLVKNQIQPAWIGYAVPAVEGNHHICCYSSEDRHVPASFRH